MEGTTIPENGFPKDIRDIGQKRQDDSVQLHYL